MLKTPNNPDGLPVDVFDGLRNALAANRSQFYRDLPSGPFYGFNRPGVKPIEAAIANWWRQGMMGRKRITSGLRFSRKPTLLR
jgi:non-heme chloroperoxidase